MDPVTVGIITAAIPFVTALVKKIFKTEKKTPTNILLPLIIGMISVGLTEFQKTQDWKVALLAGLTIGAGAGGVASSARDYDKSVIGIAEFLVKLFKKDPNPAK